MLGFLLLDKPVDISSFTCIKKLKKFLPEKTKIGHAGTLDPFASGLLIIGIGREATRMLTQLLRTKKSYEAVGKLGVLTDTLDRTGKVVATSDVHITKEQLEAAISKIDASYEQIPPVYSALKYQGKPLYALAREQGQLDLDVIVQTKKRIVTIHELLLTDFNFPFFTIKTTVSHGTYIRVLINDIAQQCNTYATTWQLQRTAIGPFSLQEAHALEAINSFEAIQNALLPIEVIKTKLEH